MTLTQHAKSNSQQNSHTIGPHLTAHHPDYTLKLNNQNEFKKSNKNSLNIAITHEKRHVIKPKNIRSSINRNQNKVFHRGLETKQNKEEMLMLLYL